VAQKLQTHNFW